MGAMRRAALLIALLPLVSCAGARAGAPPEDVLGEWELVGGTAGCAPLTLPAGARATLELGAGGELAGTSFCNLYSATWAWQDGGLRLTGLGGTEMACAPDVMAAEERYLSVLREAAGTVTVGDGELVLGGGDAELRYRPVAPEPPRSLTGSRWVLETLVQGETASSTVGEPAVLELLPDGTLTGSTGCRPLTGSWTQDGDRLRLLQLEAEGECPAEVAAQDEHVVTALLDGVAAEIEGDRLILTGDDGRGLVYRAG